MDYIKVSFSASSDTSEVIMAMVSELPFDMFEETVTGLSAFIPAAHWNESVASDVSEISSKFGAPTATEFIKDENWNSIWESNFDPVEIEEFCVIKAPFHELGKRFVHELTIQPQMSFGTGHHATTRLMVKGMESLVWEGKSVFDYGCGTGVLAFLAKKMGAGEVLALDYDIWSFQNTLENAALNGLELDSVLHGGIELVLGKQFDVILANINRNIIVQNMEAMASLGKPGSYYLMSGFLLGDEEILTAKANLFGLNLIRKLSEGDWLMLEFVRL